MKKLIILIGLTGAYTSWSQCKAITGNSMELNIIGSQNGNYIYTITANITLAYGNASIIPYYMCGADGIEVALPDCFTWEVPTTENITSSEFSCPAGKAVYVRLEGYASSNCHGNICGDVIPQSNLALDFIDFMILGFTDDRICFKWTVHPEYPGWIYELQSSSDGIDFTFVSTVQYEHLHINGTNADFCTERQTAHEYYRLKATDPEGRVLYSTIRRVSNQAEPLRMYYNMVTREVVFTGETSSLSANPIQVFNSLGHRVYQGTIGDNSVVLPVFPGGLYFVRVHRKFGAMVRKIMVGN